MVAVFPEASPFVFVYAPMTSPETLPPLKVTVLSAFDGLLIMIYPPIRFPPTLPPVMMAWFPEVPLVPSDKRPPTASFFMVPFSLIVMIFPVTAPASEKPPDA